MNRHKVAVIRKTGIAFEQETIDRYMPANYGTRVINEDTLEICGTDVAGWTLEDYVIPRLASGLYFAEPVT